MFSVQLFEWKTVKQLEKNFVYFINLKKKIILKGSICHISNHSNSLTWKKYSLSNYSKIIH